LAYRSPSDALGAGDIFAAVKQQAGAGVAQEDPKTASGFVRAPATRLHVLTTGRQIATAAVPPRQDRRVFSDNEVDHLPGDRDPKPVWLWSSATGVTAVDVDRAWQAFLRRFDLEHTFRLFKQTLGWTRPKIRTPQAADRWTWLIIAVHTQLRLARPLARDLRRPWEKPAPPGRLTPARVRRGFRNIRAIMPLPASAPKPTKAGPGRPPGSRNRRPAPHHDVGKTVRRDLTVTAHQQRKG